MRKNSIILVIMAVVLALAGLAYAITTTAAKPGQVLSFDGTLVQNVGATAPMQKAALSGSKTLTHGGNIVTFNLYSSGRWFNKVDWCVTKADGTAVTVKRTLGNNTAYMPASCGSIAVNREYTTASLATFSNTTTAAASAGYVYSVDRQ